MKELIGKRFELTEILTMGIGNAELVGITLVGDDEVIRLEVDETAHGGIPFLCTSIEQLTDPGAGENEVLTDVFCGNFYAQLL